jgi:hypothetical protein
MHKTYLLLVDKKIPKSDMTHREQRIYSHQTISISRTRYFDKLGKPVYIEGRTNDSCWMFKVESGAINAYSYLSETQNGYFSPSTIVAIQLNDGPLVKYNEENLKQMIGTDTDALEEIKKKNYYEAMKSYNKNVEKTAGK